MKRYIEIMHSRALDDCELADFVKVCDAAIKNLEDLSPIRYGITISDLFRERDAALSMISARMTFDNGRRKRFD